MVIRRRSGKILVFRKTFYPPGVLRLLTGGVERGETILAALKREVQEETGLDVHICRYLAVIRYRAETDGPIRFRTHAFLLEERGGTLGAIDADEQVEEFQEVHSDELLHIASRLENLSSSLSRDLDQDWSHWGRYRAIATRVVHDALSRIMSGTG